jgi:hypothetical protein
MKLFRDPAESLSTAQAALLAVENRIKELAAERAAKLEGDSYVDDVARIDRDIAILSQAIAAHQSRVEMLGRRQHEQAKLKVEQERLAAIERVKKALPRRHQAAIRLDAALVELNKAFALLEVADSDLFRDWSDLLPPPHRLRYLSLLNLDCLSSVRKPRMSVGLVRELAGHSAFNIATIAEGRNLELVTELEGAPAEVAA